MSVFAVWCMSENKIGILMKRITMVMAMYRVRLIDLMESRI